MSSGDILIDDCLLYVFHYFNWTELCSMEQVSKTWQRVITTLVRHIGVVDMLQLINQKVDQNPPTDHFHHLYDLLSAKVSRGRTIGGLHEVINPFDRARLTRLFGLVDQIQSSESVSYLSDLSLICYSNNQSVLVEINQYFSDIITNGRIKPMRLRIDLCWVDQALPVQNPVLLDLNRPSKLQELSLVRIYPVEVSNLKSLTLKYVDLRNQGPAPSERLLQSLLNCCHTVEHLDLAHVSVTDEAGLVMALPKLKTIKLNMFAVVGKSDVILDLTQAINLELVDIKFPPDVPCNYQLLLAENYPKMRSVSLRSTLRRMDRVLPVSPLQFVGGTCSANIRSLDLIFSCGRGDCRSLVSVDWSEVVRFRQLQRFSLCMTDMFPLNDVVRIMVKLLHQQQLLESFKLMSYGMINPLAPLASVRWCDVARLILSAGSEMVRMGFVVDDECSSAACNVLLCNLSVNEMNYEKRAKTLEVRYTVTVGYEHVNDDCELCNKLKFDYNIVLISVIINYGEMYEFSTLDRL